MSTARFCCVQCTSSRAFQTDRRLRTRAARSSASWRYRCISCVAIKVSELTRDLWLEDDVPVLAVNATLDGVAFIINHENYRLETEADHRRYFLDGQLARITAVRHCYICATNNAHMLPSPVKRMVLPKPRSRPAIAAPSVLPNTQHHQQLQQ